MVALSAASRWNGDRVVIAQEPEEEKVQTYQEGCWLAAGEGVLMICN